MEWRLERLPPDAWTTLRVAHTAHSPDDGVFGRGVTGEAGWPAACRIDRVFVLPLFHRRRRVGGQRGQPRHEVATGLGERLKARLSKRRWATRVSWGRVL